MLPAFLYPARVLLALGLGVSILATDATPLYMPRGVKAAYAKGTRSPDGRPGPAYWQNHARYAIRVSVAPPSRTVRGSADIVYFNQSPDSLRRLVLKLLVNIHKPGAPRINGVPAEYLTQGLEVDRMTINGQPARWPGNAGTFTNQSVPLPARLAPRDSVRLSLDWHYDVSLAANREGLIDSTTFYLAYFYPRIAVYDDIDGWDQMDFTDQQEFYSDFNDYDVTVSAPAHFVVWGTGTLTNAAAVLAPDANQRFQASLTSDETIRIATLAQMRARTVTAPGPVNQWRFTSQGVPDVAFGVSDHYVWDGASVVIDGRRVSSQAAYNDTTAEYRYMAQQVRGSLSFLSTQWPGVPYPYEKTTVFQGGADMEYPMMVNDGVFGDTAFAKFVAAHEIAHTWFPFYMGINETRYGFMDEGWATALEYLLNQRDMGPARASGFFQQFRVNGWMRDQTAPADMPIITPGDMMKNAAYGNNAYGKAALGYLALKEMLGDDAFRRGLHGFMDRWHGKHPLPWDMFNSFNDITSQDLNWFWKAWYFDNSYIDVAVRGASRRGRGYGVDLENVGGMPSPVSLELRYADGSADTVRQTSAIWRADLRRTRVDVPTRKTLSEVRVAGGIWMDADTTNNTWQERARR